MRVCTNPRRQVAVKTKFFGVAPKICGSSVLILLRVTLLAPRIHCKIFGIFMHFCGTVFSFLTAENFVKYSQI